MGHLEDPGTWVASDDADRFVVDAQWECQDRNDERSDSSGWVLMEAPEILVAREAGGAVDSYSPEEARKLAERLLEAADEGERRWAAAVSALDHPNWLTPLTSQ
ncbi:hypothetical protein QIS99_09000 [Streptomyces sp. B-S-A8]|uniref:Uncharacterized protein n=1 Tax=Streptomyces solicavernae TaxID=3043614 RepID=A0ABT6RRR7_9ACTN|nr:hypothetical protein [Streptomyces sp. B-S-A8]MDI3386351.1 hypothetical protein [Streptomyces sp. B-S-A8]